jgi:hypothetical protein
MDCVYSLMQELEMVKFTPSLIAASALYLSRLQLYGQDDSFVGAPPVWTKNLDHYTDYTVPELARCVREIHKTQSLASKNNLKAVYEKYSHSTFESVSLLEFADTQVRTTRSTDVWFLRLFLLMFCMAMFWCACLKPCVGLMVV